MVKGLFEGKAPSPPPLSHKILEFLYFGERSHCGVHVYSDVFGTVNLPSASVNILDSPNTVIVFRSNIFTVNLLVCDMF